MRCKQCFLAACLVSLAGTAAIADDAPGPTQTLGELRFRFDSSALAPNASRSLEDAVTYAKDHPSTRLVLDAHCDPRGTSAYNVGLAIRRARSVRDRMVALGVPRDQIVFAIYGEDGPSRPTYAEDRRVTIWPTREPLANVIDHTFAYHGTAVTWGEPLTVAQIEGRSPAPIATREPERPARQPR